MTEAKWLQRIVFLETVAGCCLGKLSNAFCQVAGHSARAVHAGVPGMVGAMLRHMKSLRSMKRDYGWIHTLLEEAENGERSLA